MNSAAPTLSGPTLLGLSEARYAWVVAGVLLLVMTVVQGIITAGIPIFDPQIMAELGVNRGALKFRDLVQILAAGTAAVSIGYIAAVVPPRRLLQVGLALLALCLFLYSKVQNIWMIYGIHVVMGFCYSSAHVVIVVLILKQWFDRRQAIAIGITLSGGSLGAAIFPQIAVRLLAHMDWRAAIVTLAVFPLLLLPFALILLRARQAAAPALETPVHHDGRERGVDQVSWTTFIPLAIAAFGIFYGAAAFIYHTFLNLKDQHFSAEYAATGVTMIFATGLAGKFLSGFLAERWGTRRVWLTHQVLLLVGAVSLTFARDAVVWPALLCLGLGWGGCFSLTQVMIAERFTGPMLARLMGWFIAFEGVGSGSGSWLTGVMFDRLGSYLVPFLFSDFLLMASIVATLMLRHPASTSATVPEGTR